jgi:hypothetical protein
VPVFVASEPFGGPLEAGTHFASSSGYSDDVDLSAGSGVGRAAIDWYDRHAHSRHSAATILSLIEQGTTDSAVEQPS